MNPEYDVQIVTGNFFLTLYYSSQRLCSLCYVNSHMNSTRNAREAQRFVAVEQRESQEVFRFPCLVHSDTRCTLVFLGDWTGTWRPVSFQLVVRRHFLLLFVSFVLVNAFVHGGEMARITAITKTEVNLALAWLSQCQGQKVNAELAIGLV